jgi:GNAT superfamily N-acetyltransferase
LRHALLAAKAVIQEADHVRLSERDSLRVLDFCWKIRRPRTRNCSRRLALCRSGVIVPAWHQEPIRKKHDREGFDRGEEALNEFLGRYARKSHELGGAKTFLAIDDEDKKTILGFYSLAPASVDYARMPEIIRRGLARHDVPGFRLARLAVDRRFQGQGIGGQLLLAAGRRCLLVAAEVGGVVLVIDAKNEKVAGWYAGFGAVPLSDAPLTLLLPLATIEAALKKAGKR